MQCLVDDPAVARKERQRLADVIGGGHNIKQQPCLARIGAFSQVKSESAVVHRVRRVFEKLELQQSGDGMLPLAVKVILRDADVSQQRRYCDIVLLENRYCEPRAVPSHGWQSLSGPFLDHIPAPL